MWKSYSPMLSLRQFHLEFRRCMLFMVCTVSECSMSSKWNMSCPLKGWSVTFLYFQSTLNARCWVKMWGQVPSLSFFYSFDTENFEFNFDCLTSANYHAPTYFAVIILLGKPLVTHGSLMFWHITLWHFWIKSFCHIFWAVKASNLPPQERADSTCSSCDSVQNTTVIQCDSNAFEQRTERAGGSMSFIHLA